MQKVRSGENRPGVSSDRSPGFTHGATTATRPTTAVPNGADAPHAIPSIRPTNFDELILRSYRLAEAGGDALEKHDRRAAWWGFVDTWTKVVVAVIASVSAVSFFADYETLTRGFTVATAVLSALNAALGPGNRAGLHQKAARGYRLPSSRARDIYDTAYQAVHREVDPVNAFVIPEGAAGAEFDTLTAVFDAAEEQIQRIADDAPYVRSMSSWSIDGAPRSWWSLHKIKRDMRRGAEYMKLNKQYREGTL